MNYKDIKANSEPLEKDEPFLIKMRVRATNGFTNETVYGGIHSILHHLDGSIRGYIIKTNIGKKFFFPFEIIKC